MTPRYISAARSRQPRQPHRESTWAGRRSWAAPRCRRPSTGAHEAVSCATATSNIRASVRRRSLPSTRNLRPDDHATRISPDRPDHDHLEARRTIAGGPNAIPVSRTRRASARGKLVRPCRLSYVAAPRPKRCRSEMNIQWRRACRQSHRFPDHDLPVARKPLLRRCAAVRNFHTRSGELKKAGTTQCPARGACAEAAVADLPPNLP